MLSGMFLLDPKKSLTLPRLFFHHILRIFAALVVWGAVYAIVDFGGVDGAFTWAGIRSALYTALLCFFPGVGHGESSSFRKI